MDPKKKPPVKEPVKKKSPTKEPVKKKSPVKKTGYWPTITLQKQQDTTTTDHSYDKRLNTILKRIRAENTFTDDKLRFGWNTGDK